MMTSVTDENFNREVLASSVPVFVHFRAPWCGLCRLITPVLQGVQADWPGQVRLLDVNADENLKLANKYQLKTLPTLLYLENGQVIHRLEGFRSREFLRAKLKDIAARHRLEGMLSKSA
ncbi:MAG: thioredoxin domain-containing protein [Cyanobacteria bacterium J06623_4]